MITSTNSADAARAALALPSKSVILLVGPVDTGKTTFAHQLIREGAQKPEILIGYVDGDIGQTETGPPGVVNGIVVSPANAQGAPRTWPIAGSAFVGATSPVGRQIEWISAVAVAGRRCQMAGADRVIVDTPGWVAGPSAITTYRALVDIVRPDLVLYFRHPGEPSPLLRIFEHRVAPPVVAVVEAGEEVGRKSTRTRQARRLARFAAYFDGAVRHIVPWSKLGLCGMYLGKAPALPRHMTKFIGDAVHANCLHASVLPEGGVHVIVETASPSYGRVAPIEEYFKTKPVMLTPAESYDHLLCGIYDPAGDYVAAALLQRVDFSEETVTLLTPLKHATRIAQIVAGSIRVSPDGRELGEVRPGIL